MGKRGGRRQGPEKVFQAEVQALLHRHGYVVDHSYALPTRDGGWRTGSTWEGKPDLLAVRPPRVLAIEVKADPGYRATERQVASLTWWSGVPNARAWLIRPGGPDLHVLEEWVKAPAEAPRTYGFLELPGSMDEQLLAAYRVLARATQRAPR